MDVCKQCPTMQPEMPEGLRGRCSYYCATANHIPTFEGLTMCVSVFVCVNIALNAMAQHLCLIDFSLVFGCEHQQTAANSIWMVWLPVVDGMTYTRLAFLVQRCIVYNSILHAVCRRTLHILHKINLIFHGWIKAVHYNKAESHLLCP